MWTGGIEIGIDDEDGDFDVDEDEKDKISECDEVMMKKERKENRWSRKVSTLTNWSTKVSGSSGYSS